MYVADNVVLFETGNNSSREPSVGVELPVALTVGELIARLEQADPETPVVICGANGGFNGVIAVTERPLKLNVNAFDGFGRHDVPGEGEQPDVTALAILCEPLVS